MKKKKFIIYGILGIVLVLIIGIVAILIIGDENKLTSDERTWINDNINTIQNINVVKDSNVFSKDGSGVFYTFLEDFSEEYDIKFNIITSEESNNKYFSYTKKINDNSKVLYTDHYVLLSKNYEIISDINDLDGKIIGVLNSDLEYIKSYLKDNTISFNGYDKEEDLLNAINNNVNYIMLPRVKYLDDILTNNLEIVYHLSDINTYYVFNSDNSTLSNIINKYLIKWEDNVNKEIKNEEFKIFTKSLGITETEIDKLLSIDYKYGFINNSPYEVIMSGNYGGIIAEYLQEFSEFSGVYFDITKYKNTTKLVNAINKGKVDLYFSFNYNIESDFEELNYGINSSMAILTNKNSEKIINSVYSLQGEEVYVEEGSNLYEYLNNIGNIKILTYDTSKELFKLNKTDSIIVMDKYIFDFYSTNKLDNYISKFDTLISDKYTFKINDKYSILSKLLNKYISYLDNSTMIHNGINSHTETVKSGNILNNIASYFIVSIVIILFGWIIYYRKSKKIKLRKKIRKDDKIRFIDELTCLKNRTYLSDFLKTWSNNTIYPQTIIVVDLNRLKDINDKYGIEEGDKQIQAAANALIKTQLDNSDLMRSDGNEFVIYTIGYNQKQIINYIHKLNKELKKLPYNYGAEFGYSIIENNLKTVEDALSEAIEDMKNKKKVDNSEK